MSVIDHGGYIGYESAIRGEDRRVRREGRRADMAAILQGVLGLAGGIVQNQQQRRDAEAIQAILRGQQPSPEASGVYGPPAQDGTVGGVNVAGGGQSGGMPNLSGLSPEAMRTAIQLLQRQDAVRREESQRSQDLAYRRERDSVSDQRWQAGHDLDRQRYDAQQSQQESDRGLLLSQLYGIQTQFGDPDEVGPPALPPGAAGASPAALRSYIDDEYRMRHAIYQQQAEMQMREQQAKLYEEQLAPMLTDPSDVAHFRVAIDAYRSGRINDNDFSRRFNDIRQDQQERAAAAAVPSDEELGTKLQGLLGPDALPNAGRDIISLRRAKVPIGVGDANVTGRSRESGLSQQDKDARESVENQIREWQDEYEYLKEMAKDKKSGVTQEDVARARRVMYDLQAQRRELLSPSRPKQPTTESAAAPNPQALDAAIQQAASELGPGATRDAIKARARQIIEGK